MLVKLEWLGYHYRKCRTLLLGLCLTYVIVIMSRHTWCNYTGCLLGQECSLNSAHWCTLFTTKDLHRISQILYRLLRQQPLAAVFVSSIICHYRLCHAVYTFQVQRAGLRVCKSCCLEPPSRSHSSPVYTCNLQKTFENVFIRWSF